MEPFFGQFTLIIFLAISSSSYSDLESGNIEGITTALLSPLSFSETYLKRGFLPPTHRDYDSHGKLNKEYRLEDFMWTGSGEGPIQADQDGGLAWEDDQDEGHYDVVRVTKTMVLYSTVLTTIYPVELTPIVVISTPRPLEPSSFLESSFSSYHLESSFEPGWTETIRSTPAVRYSELPSPLTPIFTTSLPPSSSTPAITASVLSSPGTPSEEMPSPAPDAQPDAPSIASTNRLYWVRTVIKANGSKLKTDSPDFQGPMQNNLARVYASAFKRHLLSSLGIMKKLDASPPKLRRRRSPRHLEREDIDFEWIFLKEGLTTSQIQSLATTVMNVSVSIVNITSDESQPHVSMNYIVSAEGNPIPGSSAVQDLDLVTKSEMEQQIGYEVINKAEALVSVQSTAREMSYPEKAETSPWLIVAIAAICAFILSLIGLTYLAWNSRGTAISDESPESASPQPGIEAGVINPAFLGSPRHTHVSRFEEVLSETAHTRKERRAKKSREPPGVIRPDLKQSERQETLATELRTVLQKHDHGEKVLPSSVKSRKTSSSESTDKSSDSGSTSKHRRRSQRGMEDGVLIQKPESENEFLRTPEKPSSSPSKIEFKKDSASRRRRRKTGVVERPGLETEYQQESYQTSSNDKLSSQSKSTEQRPEQRPLSASRDKITLGHLDICEDPIARSLSEKAKKSMQGHSHFSKKEGSGTISREHQKDKRKSQSASSLQLRETIDEVTDLQTTDGGEVTNLESLEEQDRELNESLDDFEPSSRVSPQKRDAQVQTPTRSRVKLKTKVKPKPRVSRPLKMSSESVFLTESEEIIDKTHFEESSVESNPLGRMRKRFHQFLDDAFNVMGNKDGENDDEEDMRSKSAKVSISHQVEKRENKRPWTTHVIHEESVERLRPKSASIGAPKRAWTDSSERRCHSAKSESSTGTHSAALHGRGSESIMEKDEKLEDESDFSSTTVPTTTSERSRPHVQSIAKSTIPIFPNYPIYPDIPILPAQQGPSHMQALTDPAVPLIQAIKEEIKRFEKVKVTEHQRSTNV